MEPQRLDLGTRFRTWPLVTVATWLSLSAAICIPYFTLGRIQWRAPVRVPVTPIDDAIAFTPEWVWVYLSIALLVAWAPALATRAVELRAFGWGLVALIVPSFLCFALWPVPGPRPEDAAIGQSWLYGWLVSVDSVWNSLPSLHAGLTVFVIGYKDRVWLRHERASFRLGARAVFVLWGAGILFATLATKQHWFWDLPPGVALGAFAVFVVGRVLGSDARPPAVA